MTQFSSLVIPFLCLTWLAQPIVASIGDHGFRTDANTTDPPQQYLLINGKNGEVIIYDTKSFNHLTVGYEEETKNSLIAVHGDTLYSMNAVRGEIKSTKVANMLKNDPTYPTPWEHCGDYPKSFQRSGNVRGNIAVMGDKIYFQSSHSAGFAYDTVNRTVKQLGTVDISTVSFVSVAAVNGIVYWRTGSRLVTYNGTHWGHILIPKTVDKYYTRMWTLVATGNSVCLIGGISDFPTAYHNSVACYDTKSKIWSSTKGLHQARIRPAAVEVKGLGILIIGGEAEGGGIFTPNWAKSVELLDEATKESSLTPYTINLIDPQAVLFSA